MTFKKAAEVAVLEALTLGIKPRHPLSIEQFVKGVRSVLHRQVKKGHNGYWHQCGVMQYACERAYRLVRKDANA